MIKILVKHSLVLELLKCIAKLLNFKPKSKVFPHGVTLNNVNPNIQLIRKKIQLIQLRISCIRSATTAVSCSYQLYNSGNAVVEDSHVAVAPTVPPA